MHTEITNTTIEKEKLDSAIINKQNTEVIDEAIMLEWEKRMRTSCMMG